MSQTESMEGAGRRTRWEHVEAERDLQLLRWVARFRFVTAAATAERFEVDVVNARRRLRRLEEMRVLGASRADGSAPLFYVARAGRERLGLPQRSAPRGDLQRSHELAIVEQVTRFERRAAAGVRVLTERECRRAEADDGERLHVTVRGDGPRGVSQRWPDIVLLDAEGRRVAVELEFAAKHTARLRRIIAGYQAAREYAQVLYLVDSVPLARRLRGVIADGAARRGANATNSLFQIQTTEIRVLPWQGADEATRGAIEAALATARRSARARAA
jgi:hypothetical protein